MERVQRVHCLKSTTDFFMELCNYQKTEIKLKVLIKMLII